MCSFETLKAVTLKLLAYCQANNWAGYDPYDALNSKIFRALPFLDFRIFRLGLTQVLKRLPFNLRPLLLIPKTENPKAIALFLMAFLKLQKLGLLEDESLIPLMVDKLINLRSPSNLINSDNLITCNLEPETRNPQAVTCNLQLATRNNYWCWGYSFPWQTRTVLVPGGAPNLVCTTFVANALLDAYEQGFEPKKSLASSDLPAEAPAHKRTCTPARSVSAKAGSAGGLAQAGAVLQPSTFASLCLNMAVSAADYIKKLYWSDGNSIASFSYPLPTLRSQTHNANFLGAALLCRVYKHTGEKKFLEPALKVARYSASKQHDDGSWDYGESVTQGWVDNFHTGYNLCALRALGKYAGTSEFEPRIRRGFEFYRKNFFREGGAPKYFHDRTYPLDIHSVAQSIITLLIFKDLDEDSVSLADAAFRWAMTNMGDEKGCFYYQALPYYKNRIPYMRWSQAWMLFALISLLEHFQPTTQVTHNSSNPIAQVTQWPR